MCIGISLQACVSIWVYRHDSVSVLVIPVLVVWVASTGCLTNLFSILFLKFSGSYGYRNSILDNSQQEFFKRILKYIFSNIWWTLCLLLNQELFHLKSLRTTQEHSRTLRSAVIIAPWMRIIANKCSSMLMAPHHHALESSWQVIPAR